MGRMGRCAKKTNLTQLMKGLALFADPGTREYDVIKARAVKVFCREISGGARINEALSTALQAESIGQRHMLDKALAAACVNTSSITVERSRQCIFRKNPIQVKHLIYR